MWSPEEDAALLKAINAYGTHNWGLLADMMASPAFNPAGRHRSARACYERCAHVLLPRDEGVREPGTLTHTESAALMQRGREVPGSLGSVPGATLLKGPPPVPKTMEAGAVGGAHRELETQRANAMPSAALQSEVTAQVRQFALISRLAEGSRNSDSKQRAQLLWLSRRGQRGQSRQPGRVRRRRVLLPPRCRRRRRRTLRSSGWLRSSQRSAPPPPPPPPSQRGPPPSARPPAAAPVAAAPVVAPAAPAVAAPGAAGSSEGAAPPAAGAAAGAAAGTP